MPNPRACLDGAGKMPFPVAGRSQNDLKDSRVELLEAVAVVRDDDLPPVDSSIVAVDGRT